MGIEAARRQVAEKAGRMAENNAMLEIRTASAKDILIPGIARFLKETAEQLKPLSVQYLKALGTELNGLLSGAVTEDGKEINYSKLMFLGGLNIMLQPKIIQIFFGYNCEDQRLLTSVALDPKMEYPQDLFTVCSILQERNVPTLKLKDGTVASLTTYKLFRTDLNKREVNIINTQVPLPLASAESVYSFVSQAWSMVGDTAFDVTI